MLKAILILPFNVLVTIPAVILYFSQFDIISPAFSLEFILMLFLLVLGFFLVIWTMRLFAAVGKGTPAPWDPIDKLIVTGPYAYVRNPMLSGVFCILFAETLLFQSKALLIYALIFIVINAIYFPLSEEKGLFKRYGEDYAEYKRNVPRFLPRLTPYRKK